jgi:hypothetical protein
MLIGRPFALAATAWAYCRRAGPSKVPAALLEAKIEGPWRPFLGPQNRKKVPKWIRI